MYCVCIYLYIYIYIKCICIYKPIRTHSYHTETSLLLSVVYGSFLSLPTSKTVQFILY